MATASAYPAFAAVNSSLTSTTMETAVLISLNGVPLTAETEIILRFW